MVWLILHVLTVWYKFRCRLSICYMIYCNDYETAFNEVSRKSNIKVENVKGNITLVVYNRIYDSSDNKFVYSTIFVVFTYSLNQHKASVLIY